MWTYRCYDDGREPNLWQRWYDSNAEYRGSHDAVFGMLEQMTDWRMPLVDLLIEKHRIFEVRLTGKVRHRILGIYSAYARKEFIILATCTHKQRVYDPHDIKKTAVKRKNEILQDLERTKPCVRPTEAT